MAQRSLLRESPSSLLLVGFLLTFLSNLQVLLFAHLTQVPTPTPLVSLSSLNTLLSSFISVVDEPGLRAARGDECVRIVVEALLRLGPGAEETESLRDGMQSYLAARRLDTELFADAETSGQYKDASWVDLSDR